MNNKRDVFHYPNLKNPNRIHQQDNEFNVESYSFVDSPKCVLTSPVYQGRYYKDNSLVRKDIVDNQEGIGLLIGLKIVDVNKNCESLPDITVDIWHCNAYGQYSGFSNNQNKNTERTPNNQTFLRGRQNTDNLGFVEFTSIFPGWHDNRTNHIHVKLYRKNQEILTTQLFFPQDTIDHIQSLPPYNERPKNIITNQKDFVLLEFKGVQGAWPKISSFGKKIMATLTIGVNVK